MWGTFEGVKAMFMSGPNHWQDRPLKERSFWSPIIPRSQYPSSMSQMHWQNFLLAGKKYRRNQSLHLHRYDWHSSLGKGQTKKLTNKFMILRLTTYWTTLGFSESSLRMWTPWPCQWISLLLTNLGRPWSGEWTAFFFTGTDVVRKPVPAGRMKLVVCNEMVIW